MTFHLLLIAYLKAALNISVFSFDLKELSDSGTLQTSGSLFLYMGSIETASDSRND